MDKLQELLQQLRNAQGWCDHNGDHGTGYVSLTVETLQYWENEVVDAITYLDELYTHYGEEWTPNGNTEMDL